MATGGKREIDVGENDFNRKMIELHRFRLSKELLAAHVLFHLPCLKGQLR